VIRPRKRLRALPADRRGVTVVEFGLVAGPLVVILLGLIDLGYRKYIGVELQGTLDQAARMVTVGGKSPDDIDTYIRQQIEPFSNNVTLDIVKKNYTNFSQVGKPEKITTDTAPVGTYNAGDCYEDLNNNGSWDSAAGRVGLGGSDDIVYYTATVTVPAIVPVDRLMGWSADETVSATMMMKNQPYASQSEPPIKCS